MEEAGSFTAAANQGRKKRSNEPTTSRKRTVLIMKAPPLKKVSYEDFLKRKRFTVQHTGITDDVEINPVLFDYQQDIVRWALRRGRSALFEDCGMGKTLQELEWAKHVVEHTSGTVIILAPLTVSLQHMREAKRFGYDANLCASIDDVRPGINITNYEKLHKFEGLNVDGVVLDESSILKSYDGKTRTQIIDMFQRTKFRLAGTATPAPNDYIELGNHAEFLGVMSRTEMMSTFFVHDAANTADWRLKGHAVDAFWKWICSWAVNIRKPSDLGYDDGKLKLPKLTIHELSVDAEHPFGDYLFAMPASSLQERRKARQSSLTERVEAASEIINNSDDQFIAWCDLNSESDALTKSIDGAVEIKGSDSEAHKIEAAEGFLSGKYRVLVSKGSIFGFGMNFQHCHKMAFVGLSDSWEMYYQCVRRCWRFGQKKNVDAYIITSKLEGAVVENIKRKERDAMAMATEMSKYMSDISKSEINGLTRETIEYSPTQTIKLPKWL
jgi:SNF2 family DNA or RNA helicase